MEGLIFLLKTTWLLYYINAPHHHDKTEKLENFNCTVEWAEIRLHEMLLQEDLQLP